MNGYAGLIQPLKDFHHGRIGQVAVSLVTREHVSLVAPPDSLQRGDGNG